MAKHVGFERTRQTLKAIDSSYQRLPHPTDLDQEAGSERPFSKVFLIPVAALCFCVMLTCTNHRDDGHYW